MKLLTERQLRDLVRHEIGVHGSLREFARNRKVSAATVCRFLQGKTLRPETAAQMGYPVRYVSG